jgi:hypothetical protein
MAYLLVVRHICIVCTCTYYRTMSSYGFYNREAAESQLRQYLQLALSATQGTGRILATPRGDQHRLRAHEHPHHIRISGVQYQIDRAYLAKIPDPPPVRP